MDSISTSRVTEFILLGFPYLQDYSLALFFMFLLIYIIIITGNTAILVAVTRAQRLHTPMYFFLSNLAIVDILLTNTTIPKMLSLFLHNANTISFSACFIQVYILHSLGVTEGLLLVVMAYDRYVAICNPLRYTVIMSNKVNILMTATSWIISFIIIAGPIIKALELPFCGPNSINHCFCDHLFVIRLACADISLHTYIGFSIAMAVAIVPLTLVGYSYIKIIKSVLNICSSEDRWKVFSTCSSHLMVVVIYYLSIGVTYISYRVEGSSDEFHAIGTVFFTILTPMLNPIIYTLRNKDVKDTLMKMFIVKLS
ncbi:olfactory receptor 2AT4-like isoform X2 [Protopterus annectens]|uniref:olfactory receptor 2AT4-like isoform X2 n=1 Tax=Protopterus annectens TaxID=7888 RepID=UPI001CFA489A|nr:olfactory receptor 2AT4-like isoform X2 [Protopterus annectens]